MKKIICLIAILNFSSVSAFAVGICEEEAYSSYEASESEAFGHYWQSMLTAGLYGPQAVQQAADFLNDALYSALGSLQGNLATCSQGNALINQKIIGK